MKPIWFGLAGTALQGGGLVAFILISRMSFAAVGKPIVIGMTFFGVLVLLWHGVKQVKSWSALIALSALLALGSVVALHAVWLFWFRGLLHDIDFSVEYLLFVFRWATVLFLLYCIEALFIYFVNEVWQKRTRPL